ncbi:hypothetical protein NFH98_20875 [Halomonas sp. H33-56]|uniref:hypothetical protein n=1 Tax=Halomonas sp. H33-56 TaxID=2950873 RepID=UPI0032DF7EA8
MTAFVHAATLSETEAVAAIESHFALVGYARYLKALEVIAAEGEARAATLSWDGWAAALAGDQERLAEFFAFCAEWGALTFEDDGERVTVGCPELTLPRDPREVLPPPDEQTLYTTSEQWAAWFEQELSFPPAMAKDPKALRMFRRWCASNVTVGEMNAAVQRAVADNTGMNPAALHRQLQALRRQRLEDATTW